MNKTEWVNEGDLIEYSIYFRQFMKKIWGLMGGGGGPTVYIYYKES